MKKTQYTDHPIKHILMFEFRQKTSTHDTKQIANDLERLLHDESLYPFETGHFQYERFGDNLHVCRSHGEHTVAPHVQVVEKHLEKLYPGLKVIAVLSVVNSYYVY